MGQKVEVDMIVKAITEGFDKIGSDIKKTGDDVDKTGNKFTELKSQIDLAWGAAQKAGKVFEVAFQQLERGATVIQTAESFDLLINKVGGASDLLQQLDTVAGGTISQMELMTSTSTLLAGAQGEVATALANATPQLLEIAKASNKLNPALGSTTFLYNSLATGIKRSSPLILDNLGLTIKIGEANQKYADSLGKTVGELTAQEKQVALLNETLRAGNVLLQQVGGNTDSATDSIEKLKASVADAKDNFAAWFADGIIPIVEGAQGADDALDNLIKRTARGSDTFKEYSDTLNETTGVTQAFITLSGLNAEVYFEQEKALQRLEKQLVKTTSRQDELGRLGRDRQIGGLRQEVTLDTTTIISDIAAIQQMLPLPLFDELDLNIGSTIQGELDKINFQQAGGAEVQAQFAQLRALLDAGLISLESYESSLERLQVKAANVAIETGKMTLSQAAVQLGKQLGVTYEEALRLLEGVNAELDSINQKKVTAFLDIVITESGERPAAFSGRNAIGGAGGTQPEMRQAGGRVSAGKPFIVGEAGSELFVPNQSGNIIPNNQLGGMGGMVFSIANLTIVSNDPADMFEGIEREARARGFKFESVS